MKKYLITIDGGTTNTRCILWDNKRIRIGEECRGIGVRNTAIDGNNEKLKLAVKECLELLIKKNNAEWEQIHCIIASGMITSDVGLTEVPHLTAPAGLDELAASMAVIHLDEICPIPICLIPGIKNSDQELSLENIETMDIMRGEETESIPIIERHHAGFPMTLVLPGSHNKFISVDADKRITGCLTTISGELLASITNDTIIAKSVEKQFLDIKNYDRNWMLEGYKNAQNNGLGRACFSARILHLFKAYPAEKIQNYILGASLAGDITAVMHSDVIKAGKSSIAVVCGKNPLQQALMDILNFESIFKEVKPFSPEGGMPISALGAYMIAEKCKILE